MAMNRTVRAWILAAMLVVLASCGTGGASRLPQVGRSDSIRLESSAFPPGGSIPSHYTCDGADASPPLDWSGGPPAEEYALIMSDRDAPGGEFVHWTAYAIPGSTTTLPEGAVSTGAKEGTNDFGRVGYGGPCPPKGGAAHRYVFTIYALRVASGGSVPEGASLETVLDAIGCCIEAQGTLTGTYGR